MVRFALPASIVSKIETPGLEEMTSVLQAGAQYQNFNPLRVAIETLQAEVRNQRRLIDYLTAQTAALCDALKTSGVDVPMVPEPKLDSTAAALNAAPPPQSTAQLAAARRVGGFGR